MVSRGKRYAKKDREKAFNNNLDGHASPSAGVASASQIANEDHEQFQYAECANCESPCDNEDEAELTPCCLTPLCPLCFELEVLENEKCPISTCQRKISKVSKPLSISDSEVYEYKKHFVDESSNIAPSSAITAEASTSTTAKTNGATGPIKTGSPKNSCTPSFTTARASPPKEWAMSEKSFESEDFMDDEALASIKIEEKAREAKQDARQTLEAATTHLIEIYNAMAEYLNQEERSAAISSAVIKAGRKLH
ncbi:hypothetical protein P7C71_g1316, partial [Lecanoromycetidae sp. Uapishka_2]